MANLSRESPVTRTTPISRGKRVPCNRTHYSFTVQYYSILNRANAPANSYKMRTKLERFVISSKVTLIAQNIARNREATERSWELGCVSSAVLVELKKKAENLKRFAEYCPKI